MGRKKGSRSDITWNHGGIGQLTIINSWPASSDSGFSIITLFSTSLTRDPAAVPSCVVAITDDKLSTHQQLATICFWKHESGKDSLGKVWLLVDEQSATKPSETWVRSRKPFPQKERGKKWGKQSVSMHQSHKNYNQINSLKLPVCALSIYNTCSRYCTLPPPFFDSYALAGFLLLTNTFCLPVTNT